MNAKTNKLNFLKKLAEKNKLPAAGTAATLTKALIAVGELRVTKDALKTAKPGDYVLWVGGQRPWWERADSYDLDPRDFEPTYVQLSNDFNQADGSVEIHLFDGFGDPMRGDRTTAPLAEILFDRRSTERTHTQKLEAWRKDVDKNINFMLSELKHLDSRQALAALFLTGELGNKVPTIDAEVDRALEKARNRSKFFAKCDWGLDCPPDDKVNPFRLVASIYQYASCLELLVCRATRRLIANAKRSGRAVGDDADRVMKLFMLTEFFKMLMGDVVAYTTYGKPIDDHQEVALDMVSSLVVNELKTIEDANARDRMERRREEQIAALGDRIDSIWRAALDHKEGDVNEFMTPYGYGEDRVITSQAEWEWLNAPVGAITWWHIDRAAMW